MMHYVQTEDGIRNYKVTGVQTCALPIYPQMVENDSIVNIEDPKLGTVKQVGALARFSETPSEISTGAPAVGQHQAELRDRKGVVQGKRARHGGSGARGGHTGRRQVSGDG